MTLEGTEKAESVLVRVRKHLHRPAQHAALDAGQSLLDWVSDAIDEKLARATEERLALARAATGAALDGMKEKATRARARKVK